jgi:sigma-E factor negative regulatory protein RseA
VKEKLSALVDNELGEFEERRVLEELDRDPQLRGIWQRYHLIRAAMANELDYLPSHTSTERLAAMLAAEPVVTARRSIGQLPRMAGGLAIAATVAGIAIFGLQMLGPAVTSNPKSSSPASMVSAKSPAPMVAETRAVEPSAAIQTVRSNSTRWDTPEPDDEHMLDVYLVQHSEFASAGVRGMLPSYARVVGYSSDR